ncbi:MAG TPA: agmatine deiminase family protein [bacterium]|nr:agmatine deiminase family protein [bacterium]HPS29672.1 agmatine deiminase family protein [bacterium]
MKKIVLLIVMLSFSSVLFAAGPRKQPLPAWNDGVKTKVLHKMDLKVPLTPPDPSKTIYVPAEFSSMEGVLIQVPVGWNELYPYYSEMIKTIIKAGAVPYIIADSTYSYQGQTYNDIEDITAEVLEPNGIDVNAVVFLDYDYDANWTRDYGPWYIYLDGERAIVNHEYYSERTNDNAINGKLADRWGEEIFSTGLYTEGGNFMTDGLGTCWASTGVVEYNVTEAGWTESDIDSVYKDYLNCSNGIYHPVSLPNEGTTHIDMYSKILDQNTIIVSYSTAELGATQDEIDTLDAAAEFYANTPKPDGGEWNIVRIPMTFGDYSAQGDTWRVQYTHTNSTIVNDYVIVPIYDRGTDEEGLKIYQDLLPRHHIVGVLSNDMIVWGGSIHCTTMQLPVKTFLKCGNGVVETGEECDTQFTNGVECKDLEGFKSGLLKCNADCTYDISSCSESEVIPDEENNDGETADEEISDNETGDNSQSDEITNSDDDTIGNSDADIWADDEPNTDSNKKSSGCSITLM